MQFIRNDPELKKRRRELRRNHTDAERLLWSRLRNRQFFGVKFFRQYSVGPYILDFFCPKTGLAIELDGGQHAEKENQDFDLARTAYLKGQGIAVLRFWNNDVMQNREGVLERIAERINSADPGWLTPPDPLLR